MIWVHYTTLNKNENFHTLWYFILILDMLFSFLLWSSHSLQIDCQMLVFSHATLSQAIQFPVLIRLVLSFSRWICSVPVLNDSVTPVTQYPHSFPTTKSQFFAHLQIPMLDIMRYMHSQLIQTKSLYYNRIWIPLLHPPQPLYTLQCVQAIRIDPIRVTQQTRQ